MTERGHHPYKRFCKECSELFSPKTKYTRYCESCLAKRKLAGQIRRLSVVQMNKPAKDLRRFNDFS